MIKILGDSKFHPLDIETVTISEKNNFFVWTPFKTASTLSSRIIENFDCQIYSVFNRKLKSKGPYTQNHNFSFFNNHQEYKFIMTVRNPYRMMVSAYLYRKKNLENTNKEDFFEFAEKFIHGKFSIIKTMKVLHEREPDYFIRTENIYQDYLKIPFILNSEFFKSGKLKNLIETNVNANPLKYDWRQYYNQKNSDLVYYSMVKYFEIFGYEKNSWILGQN